jgi:hypothetical protein
VETHRQKIIEKTGCSVLELMRACCYELGGDQELWRALGETAVSYNSLQGRRPRRSSATEHGAMRRSETV